MVCVHSTCLATIVASFICVFIIHVVRDSNFGEDERMITHIFQTLIPKELELVTQTVSDSRFSDLNSKRRSEILAAKDAYDINIVEAIPTPVSSTLGISG